MNMSEPVKIRVWDLPVRVFHWSLVTVFAVAFLSGDEFADLHVASGYLVLGLVAFRVLWGFIGGRYARFSDFVRGPATAVRYARSLLAGTPERYLGHNPLGGWMILLLLLAVGVTGWSGILAQTAETGSGGAALEITWLKSVYADGRNDADEHASRHLATAGGPVGEREGKAAGGDEFWEEVHEAAAYSTLFLILLHILGVIVSSRLHRENLVRAMLTGDKAQEPGLGDERA
jgi:cytochrome b